MCASTIWELREGPLKGGKILVHILQEKRALVRELGATWELDTIDKLDGGLDIF